MKIVILGFGNVGQHLFEAFSSSDKVDVVQVYNRSRIYLSPNDKVDTASSLSVIRDADIYIIAISDDEISEFSEKLTLKNKLVVHTSGSLPMNQLSDTNRKGVFYPLQTFSKDMEVDFKQIPICVEAENLEDLSALKELGAAISEKIEVISSEEREKLHLAAVFVNNFTNHLYHISENILKEENLDFDLLKPLIAETARKVNKRSPSEVQTGPAKRKDKKTIEKHLKILSEFDSPGLQNSKELYQYLTSSIYGKKL